MTDSPRSRRRLWPVPLLLAILAITTAWAPSAPSAGPGQLAGRHADDISSAAQRIALADIHPVARQGHPQRTFASPLTTSVSNGPLVPVAAPKAFSGRNHFWIPTLGISQNVFAFPCSRKREPANVMYRWGCAGTNNVYIFGHAYGVMKALHDAYVAGRLKAGMIAIYADAAGTIRSYQVTTWRVVVPSNSSWAIASQPVPSMTLQTCLGSRSQWRLNIRLVAVD